MNFQELVEVLVDHQSSDLHLMAGLKPALRINRQIVPIAGLEPFSAEEIEQLIFSILSDEQKNDFLNHPEYRYEMDVAYSIPGMGRFRVNVYKQRGTYAAVIRALSFDLPKLESLGLPECVDDFVEQQSGLLLITGPGRSGKSTTMAALIHRMNQTRSSHIVTIEDPIEYLHNSVKSYVSQREVGRGADTTSMKLALKQAIRQDPDVIQIGNLEDYEMIEIGLNAADHGTLVLGTLPTISVAQTLSRIIDVFPVDKNSQILTALADNLVGIISQLLIPRVDGEGYCLASEVLKVNTQIRASIRQNKLEGIYHNLFQSFDKSFLTLAKDKMIDYESIQAHIRSDSTHRQVQSMLGISRPITHLPNNFNSAPIKEFINNPNERESTGMRDNRPQTKVEYRTGFDQKPVQKSEQKNDTKTLGKTIVPPWEKEKQ